MQTLAEIAKQVAVLNSMEHSPRRKDGSKNVEPGREDEQSAAVFLSGLQKYGILTTLLDTPTGQNLVWALRRHRLELIPKGDNDTRMVLAPRGKPSDEDAKYAEALNALQRGDLFRKPGKRLTEGQNPVPRILGAAVSRWTRHGRTTAPERALEAALARHGLKLTERAEERPKEGRLEKGSKEKGSKGKSSNVKKRKWYLVEASGKEEKRAAGVGVGVEEGRGHGQDVVPVRAFGADAGPSSWSAGEGPNVHAMQAGEHAAAVMLMHHAEEQFGGADLEELASSAAYTGWSDEALHSAVMRGELSSGTDASEWYDSWSAAPVNSVAPHLSGFPESGVGALPWGAGGSGGEAFGFPAVGVSGDYSAGSLVAQYAGAGMAALPWGPGGSAGEASVYPRVAPSSFPPPGRSAGHSR
ncbi:hypothetical protein [Streptomyces sp. NPDC006012]|uniref:hypothetical protein n=1 Tax=Streptomyces sp. NPDC006012 TaxID=3364739 RepID=UPI0036D1E7D3